ncbi:ribonuclease M5 [Paenibacillus eucommiae]|uniref:Ribonuclease M5 n=1 Tax=Paenibacillus eucommiae TaxID=1355755 RepID=A0ABS4J8L2_9BACL|nr:ribonuclease M5 [Paenibacillus eucommiae]MBP1996187.1 ribonuclease M5 [Paenibacillus eucommiae]
MIKEIIVVEGKSDTAAIHRAVEAETIETGGSAIGAAVLQRIMLAQQRRGVIILTDPDHAGERIRKIVAARVPGCKHAFIIQELAEHKGDIGIENASPEAIRDALANVKSEYQGAVSQLAFDDLIKAGLMLHPDAAARRLEVGKTLGIGYCNGKQFYKRCTIFQISREEFEAAVEQLDRRGLKDE